MTRATLAIALCGLLCACATPGPDRITVQTVYGAVPTPCSASPGPAPAYADTDAAITTAPDIFAVSKLRMAARQQALEYIARLEAANKACGPK
jgi:hypothetical protein